MALGPAAHRAADMSLCGGLAATIEDERLEGRKSGVKAVNGLFKHCDMTIREGTATRIRLAGRRGKTGAHIEDQLLDFPDEKAVFCIFIERSEEAEMGTELVDGAIRLKPNIVFFHTTAIAKTGATLVASTGVNVTFFHVSLAVCGAKISKNRQMHRSADKKKSICLAKRQNVIVPINNNVFVLYFGAHAVSLRTNTFIMKRCALLLLAALFVETAVQADVITPSKAIAIAEEFLGESVSPQRVRGMNRTAPATGECAPYYVISRGEDKGFVLVSGDDCLPEVLGYTESGDFNADDMSPAFADMLDCISRAVEEGQKHGSTPRTPRKAAASRVTINPLMTSHWHQDAPYNLLCPICSDNNQHAVVGCVATATSQVIYYFRKDLPQQLLAKTPTYKGGDKQCDVTVSFPKGTPIEYDLMFDSYTNNEPEDLRMTVATLCYTIGTASRLGYWHSSGGYISESNKAMKSHFGLYGTNLSRGSMDIRDWESIIYTSLAAQKPLLYSGFTTDGESGHAINIDGYNARNGLWHFNFGWGGSGDGWYTLDLENGVNGFCMWQEIVYNITPLQPNLNAEIHCADTLYRRVLTHVDVDITNNGTVPVNGFNLFLQTAEKAPTANNTPSATDNGTYIAPGETKTISFEVRPTLARTYYVYATDANRHPITHTSVVVNEAAPSLTFHGLTARTSDKVESVNGTNFYVLNNTDATLVADVSNSSDATPSQPTVKFLLNEWNPETGEETVAKTKSLTNVVFDSGERKLVTYEFTKLKQGTCYVGRVSADDWTLASADSLVYFIVGTKTLAAESTADGTAILTGDWDASVFASMADDATIAAYDLRNVNGVTAPLEAANPNALFYVSTPIEGKNVVVDGICADLRLVSGYDFRPLEPFRATKASYTPDFVPGTFYSLILPFACARPSEYICRYVKDAGRSYFAETVTVKEMDAATPYMVLTNSSHNVPFTATNVNVVVEPDTAVTKPFLGSFTHSCLYDKRFEPSNYILELDVDPSSATQYFQSQDTTYIASPFTPMLSSNTKKVRASSEETTDKAYKKLAIAVDQARTLYNDLHTNICDSVNAAMNAMLDEALQAWATAEAGSTDINKLAKNVESMCATYPLMANVLGDPIDYTSLITNPSFESNNKTGWKTDSRAIIRNITTINTYIARADGKFFLHNNNTGKSTGISQTISNLRTGYYRLTALTGTEEGGVVNLFAGDSVYAAPASELGKYYLTESVIDSVWVDNGELTIGIKEGDTWYKCDNFQLHYLGDGNNYATAIRPVEATPEQPARHGIFSIDGTPVACPEDMQPGVIYIVNGRKVMKVE